MNNLPQVKIRGNHVNHPCGFIISRNKKGVKRKKNRIVCKNSEKKSVE